MASSRVWTVNHAYAAPRARKFLVGAIASVLSLVVFIVVVELVFAQFAKLPHAALEKAMVPSWRFNHTWRANSTLEHVEWMARNPDFDEPYTHTFNAQGWLEDRDYDKAKPPLTRRMFFVGDSFTEGTVPMDQSVPSVVERHFASVFEQPAFEVINTGTSSYSPLIYYTLAKYSLLEYAPDAIVVIVDMTDVYDDWKYRQTALFDEQGDPRAVPPRNIYSAGFVDTELGAVRASWLVQALFFLRLNSYTFNFLRDQLRPSAPAGEITPGRCRPERHPQRRGEDPRVGKLIKDRWAWCRHQWDAETEADVAFSLDMLERLIDLLHGAGVTVVLSSVPHYQQYAERRDASGKISTVWSTRPHEVLSALAARKQVAYFDAYRALEPHIRGSRQSDYYYAGDMHFNPRGYALWSEAFARFLEHRVSAREGDGGRESSSGPDASD